MSPHALLDRARELGLDWLAITDHNSMANCAAYEKVIRAGGVAFSWGVEVQTAEEIHVLVYFDDSSAALAFDAELYKSLLPIENDADFFGDQVIIDENEDIIRMEKRALAGSSQWELEELWLNAQNYGGFVVPAHVDAGVNSIISQLGFIPQSPVFEAFGITAKCDLQRLLQKQSYFADKALLRASDAHYLSDLGTGFALVKVAEPSIRELRLAALGQDERMIDV